VISLGTHRRTGDNFGFTWEHLGAPASGVGAPVTCLGAPRITVKQSGRNAIICGNVAGAPGNDSYYVSFNDC
jgi:hypothetical protein